MPHRVLRCAPRGVPSHERSTISTPASGARRPGAVWKSRLAALVVASLLSAARGARASSEAPRPDPRWAFVVCLRGDSPSPGSPIGGLRLGTTPVLWRGLTDLVPTPPRAVSTRAGLPVTLGADPRRIGLIEAADSAAASRVAQALSADPSVAWFEPNMRREPARAPEPPRRLARATISGLPPGFPNDPLFADARQWGLENRGPGGPYGGLPGADIRARAAWALSRGSPGLRLAIADTGVDPAHPDLQQALPDGLRLERGLNTTDDVSGSWADSLGHGTAVAGVMAARTNDGPHFDSLGVAGVCGGDGGANPGCRIVPLKITPGHSPYAWSFDVARAIVYAVAVGARAVNLSFAASSPSRVEREALRYAMERNCLVVAAAGNNAARDPRAAQYPAAFSADGLCLQVGASDPWDRRAPWSSYGPGLDLLAPGSNVWTTSLTYPGAGSAYRAASGTSLSAPFATGASGLLAAARPELCADDLRQLLRATARDVGAPGPDEQTGTGVLDAAAALAAVSAGVGIWHDEVAAETWFETGTDSLVVGENGPGAMTGPRTWPFARRFEARATVTLPDSFADSVRIWPRVAGTSSVRGDFRLPYFAPRAEIERLGARTFVLRGYFYRVPAGPDGETDLPLPADQIRFGFTVIGPLVRPAVADPRPGGREPEGSLRVSPNPFRASLRIERASGAAVSIYDLAGRRVREWPADGSVEPVVWNARTAAGAPATPGLYWVRSAGAHGVAFARAIKLE